MASDDAADLLLDENNNDAVDLNSGKLLLQLQQEHEHERPRSRDSVPTDDDSEHGECDDVSEHSDAPSGQAYSVSTTSVPPEDPERLAEKTDDLDGSKLKGKVKELEAQVLSLTSQLSDLGVATDFETEEQRTRAERERCVVLKCIPQAHVANDIIVTRVSEFFKIPQKQISIQVTDQLSKWCVIVLHTPSRHYAVTILRKFPDFRKLYKCYHRTQALPCFSNAERQLYQKLWAQAIERNNREGYRLWEVDPQELRLVETVGTPQKWRVKVHYFPDTDSPTASTSASEVRRRQRGQQSPPTVCEKTVVPEARRPKQLRRSTHGKASRSDKKESGGGGGGNGGGRSSHSRQRRFMCYPECPNATYVHHYPSPLPYGPPPYYMPGPAVYSTFYGQPLAEEAVTGNVVCITSNGLNS